MGVVTKTVKCLSQDSENEKYYMAKAFVGDLITVFTSGGKVYGKLVALGDKQLKIQMDNGECHTMALNTINSFQVEFRCQESSYKYGAR